MSISAPGKVILFGEHSVVYGFSALATSLDAFTTLNFRQIHSHEFPDLVFTICFKDFSEKSIRLNAAHLDLNLRVDDISFDLRDFFLTKSRSLLLQLEYPTEVVPSVAVVLLSWYLLRVKYHEYKTAVFHHELTFSSTLPMCSGLGSSAAYCTVVAAFFLYVYGLVSSSNPSDDDLICIQSFAHELEKVMHDSPSGVDTAISTSGGMVLFKKSTIDEETFIRPLKIRLPHCNIPKLIVIDTKMPRSTADIVKSVRQLYESQPDLCRHIFKEIEGICEKAVDIFSAPVNSASWNQLSKLFGQNHQALCKLGVSNWLLDEIVRRLENIGIGAKLTGAGRGGCVIALPCSNGDSVCALEKIRSLFKDLDIFIFEVAFCVPGVRIQPPSD